MHPMDLKTVPESVCPAYAWLWNDTITREGIEREIDEMEKNGIRAFYVIGEPDNWFPDGRATHLSPPYLSDEYIDLLFYAFEKAKEKGICMWLYDEGAWPSGAACGQITEKYPELAYQYISARSIALKKGEAYAAHPRALAAFTGNRRVPEGYVPEEDSLIREYYRDQNGTHRLAIRADNADRRASGEFIRLTHEKLKKRFGGHMGGEIRYMFDDEAYMGGWTKDLDKIFYEKYGYDLTGFLPFISRDRQPGTDEEYRAVSDYVMLCGDLLRENYFLLMRDWLRKTGMRLTGHLDNDDKAQGAYMMRYGNVMKTMRSFDVPGIDVIWEQISYPENGKCCRESMAFYPRLASSAARQIGKNVALSESFAVYGAQVTPDLMRFVVNYQAVRGINLFNFMAISYDRETPMRHQFRPNFLGDNVGMDCLRQINDYTARLSYILQTGKSEVRTALYYPFRSICAGGEKGKKAADGFVALGEMLENRGVSFDFIDEDFVLSAAVKEGSLEGEFVTYDCVFTAHGDFEIPEVTEKLSRLRSEIRPDIRRNSPSLQARKILFEDGGEGVFLVNQGGERLRERIEIGSRKRPYEIDLFTGDVYAIPFERKETDVALDLSLLRGEGVFLWLTDGEPEAEEKPVWESYAELKDFRSSISRIYKLDREKGVRNILPEPAWQEGLIEWDDGLSGEATYITKLPELEEGEYRLDLGEVRHYAKVYINGIKAGESTVYPYTVLLKGVKGGEELKIVVANTPANECARSDYFKRHLPKDVGPYHERMVLSEAKEKAGGLFGPVRMEVKR